MQRRCYIIHAEHFIQVNCQSLSYCISDSLYRFWRQMVYEIYIKI